MASGPEHYKEAETLLGYLGNSGPDPAGELIAAAQVHATLALAAATADPFADQPQWAEALR